MRLENYQTNQKKRKKKMKNYQMHQKKNKKKKKIYNKNMINYMKHMED